MSKIRLSSKGQVVLPKAVRESHGLLPGDELIIEDLGDEIVLRSAVSRSLPKLDMLRKRLAEGQPIRISDIAGVMTHDGPARSVEEMDDSIGRSASGRDARSRH